ncbi:endolytic transglycosylase MltG [Deinococcus roseus]|uniref:Endolytic murein transglycosylase n=1 Tax=Deinococcus roseus TaxID=392414 RepID=A0ABQ2D1S7_9DEIO|nr:endolytic transglycosylase MltG [Deinococcus roseus]GGJ42199.1 aminodeoxychorismate lyase [Deinococcus roseus]
MTRKKSSLSLLLAFALIVVFLVAVVVNLYRHYTVATGAGKYTLEVKPGTSVTSIARELQEHQIVRNADVFRLVLKQRGRSASIQEGIYQFSGEQDIFQVAETLEQGGKPRVIQVVIPEGKRLKDIIGIVTKSGISNASALQEAVAQQLKNSKYASGSLEGFLFPATYPFRPETTAAEVIQTLTRRMEQEFTLERIEQAKALGFSVQEWVTLASVVQAEAANTQEMPLIAGLFLNRIKIGMPLQSDPTVAYGLGKDLPQLDRSAGDFQKDTPYNSYTRRELPPTPINNPGEAALLSILNSQRLVKGKPALYFVHGRDRQIHVNSDFDSHLRDVERYR